MEVSIENVGMVTSSDLHINVAWKHHMEQSYRKLSIGKVEPEQIYKGISQDDVQDWCPSQNAESGSDSDLDKATTEGPEGNKE